MSNLTELESALSDVFDSFDDITVADGEVEAVETTEADVREIRTHMMVLAGSRPSGN